MADIRITMVGGGSYSWCPKLLCDMMHEDALSGSEVILYDINLRAAEEIKAAAERIAADNGKKFRFIATDNEDEAFTKVDFVVITISTGGLDMMTHDLAIPEKYGIYQAVGDSVGPGGWSRNLRNIPVFAAMAKKIARLSPRAVVLNYTNPMAGLTGVFSAVSDLRAVGLCHGPVGTMHYLAKLFGTDVGNICGHFGGINHLFWILNFTVNGENGYELLKRKLNGAPLIKYDKSYQDPDGIMETDHEVLSELYSAFGYLTYTADNHTAEFFNCYLRDLAVVEKYKIFRKTIPYRRDNLAKARQVTLDIAGGKIPMYKKSCEITVNILKSIITNNPCTEVVNLPNTGQIDNLPRGAVLETLGVVDPVGFTPVAVGAIPETLRAICEPHCRVQLMTLEAGLTGNKKLAMEALTLDPLCAGLTPRQTREMGDELLKATAAYLPQFK